MQVVNGNVERNMKRQFVVVSEMWLIVVGYSFLTLWLNVEGRQTNRIQPLIINGDEIDIKRAPWQVLLLTDDFGSCGGAILSRRYAVTAAHCLQDIAADVSLSLKAGVSRRDDKGSRHKIKTVLVHPSFDTNTQDFDVAILEVSPPFHYDRTRRPIKLAKVEPKKGEATITGWGITEDSVMSEVLKLVNVPIVSRKVCNRNYLSDGGVNKLKICAGSQDSDACQGDSGGPLVVNRSLVGITAYGRGCAQKNLPGVYTNIANPMINRWITDVAKLEKRKFRNKISNKISNNISKKISKARKTRKRVQKTRHSRQQMTNKQTSKFSKFY